MSIGLLASTAVALVTVALVAFNDGTNSAAAASRNLIRDPEFRGGLTYWITSAGANWAAIAGPEGQPAIRITSPTSAAKTLVLNDRANTVDPTTAGTTYQASAWVRTTAPGTSAAIRLGEWRGSVGLGGNLSSVWLRDSGWHQLSVSYKAISDDASIDWNVLAWAVPAGASLDVAAPSLVSLSADGRPSRLPEHRTPPPSTSSIPTLGGGPSTTPGRPSTAQPPPVTIPPVPTRSTIPPTTVPATTSPPQSSASPPAANGYRLVWSDEFTGGGVDRSKWNVRDNWAAANEESIATSRSQNVDESGGVLTLRAQRERFSTAGGTTRDFTSGYLDTMGKGSWHYGRFEMRAKLPMSKGMWPAFWLRGDRGPGEVDIMEAVGGNQSQTTQSVHQSTNGGQGRAGHDNLLDDGTTIGDWHVYGLTLEPNAVTWDIDGKVVFQVTSATAPWLPSTFNEPVNIRLNLQVGGSMPAYYRQPVDASTGFPAAYQVDYVRVFQKG